MATQPKTRRVLAAALLSASLLLGPSAPLAPAAGDPPAKLAPKGEDRIGPATRPAPQPDAGSPFRDFAGRWTGKTKFQDMDVELLVDAGGAVIGGRMGTHPFQKKGKVVLADAKQPTRKGGFTIRFYFSDVCRDQIKTIEGAAFTVSADGRHKIEGQFSNPCFPPSNGWIRLARESATSQPAASAPIVVTSAEDCRKLYSRGDYAEAAAGYKKLSADKAIRVVAGIGLAEALGAQGKYTEAVDALKAAPDSLDAGWNVAMAEALAAVGDYTKAIEHARKAYDLRGDWAPAILVLGNLLEVVGQKRSALAVYRCMEKVIDGEAYRRDARSLVALGGILDRHAILSGKKASDSAANILHNYLQEAYQRVDPSYWQANLAAGMFLLSRHRPQQAAGEFQLARKINKNCAEAIVGLGAIELGHWRFEEAMKASDAALKINPNLPDGHLLRAVCLMQWRKFEQVPPVIEKVLKVNPNHLDALSLMAAVHVRAYEPKKAEEFIQRVKKINPTYAELPNTIGEWLAAGRQFAEAEKYYKQAIDVAPELAGPITNLGLMYMQTGDEDKAAEVLRKAHEMDDFRADVVNYLNVLNSLKKFLVRETKHFIVKLDGQHDAVLLDQVADYMERIHQEICDDFAYTPERKTMIEIMPTHQAFSMRISGRGWIGTVGACTGRVIALATPDERRSQFGNHNWATVLRHEYTHTVTLAATRNRIPHWFTEACAVWEQPDRRSYEAVRMLRDATRSGRLFPVKSLDWGFIRPRRRGDRSLAYAQSEWIMEFIIAQKGYRTIPNMLKGFRDGLTQKEVFETIVGIKESEFDKAFADWAKQQVRQWGFTPEPPPKLAEASKQVKTNPNDAAAHADHAVALFYGGKRDAARKAAQQALRIDPNNTRALAVLATILMMEKKYDEAAASAKKLETLDKKGFAAPRVLAGCYLAKRAWADALLALELLKQRQPLDPYSYERLAEMYVQFGQPEKALPNLIELHPRTMRDPKYARQIAEICRTLDRDDEALHYFQEIAHIDPFEASSYKAIAEIHFLAERYRDAVAAAQNLCLVSPESANAWTYMAKIRYFAGRNSKDKAELERALQAAEKAVSLDAQSAARQLLPAIEQAIKALET